MTDMTERSVREHLHNLEHAYGKIRREHRRKGTGRGKGEYTSDGIWLLAPAHRLRPPRRGDASFATTLEEPPENFAVGEKRACQRKTFPPGGRKSFPGNRQGVEPSGDPSVAPAGARASPEHRPDTYVRMIKAQSRLLGVPLERNQLGKISAYAKTLIEKQEATHAQMLRWAAHYATRRNENPKIQPSQAWADVAGGSGTNGGSLRRNGAGSTAVIGASEDLFREDI